MRQRAGGSERDRHPSTADPRPYARFVEGKPLSPPAAPATMENRADRTDHVPAAQKGASPMETVKMCLEQARQDLYAAVEACGGDLSHPAVIAASQRLDNEIVRYMMQHLRAASHTAPPNAPWTRHPHSRLRTSAGSVHGFPRWRTPRAYTPFNSTDLSVPSHQ
jgi:hypothetical protein